MVQDDRESGKGNATATRGAAETVEMGISGTSARAELEALRNVLQQYDPSLAGRIDYVLRGPDTYVGAFLTSGELWGGPGSIVERAGAARWRGARPDIQGAFLALGDWQISHGLATPAVQHWVEVLKGRRGLQWQSGEKGAGQGAPGKPAAVPWSTRDVWLGVVVAAVVVAATIALTHLLRTFALRHVDLWLAIFPAALELLFLVPVWWFAVRKYHASARTLGIVRFGFSVVGIGLGLLLLFYFANAFYARLLQEFGLRVQSDMTPVLRGVSTPWPLFATIVLIAPFVEETFFRSFVFAGLRSRYDWRKAAVISAALFAAAHMELTFFIPAFALGLLFAYLYQRSDSIWPGMIVHTLMNALAVTLAYWVV